MKKIILWITLSLASVTGLMAQPGFYFSNETACEGENLCVDVSVVNFSNITGTSYQIRWDPTILQYVNPNLYEVGPGMSFTIIQSALDAAAASNGSDLVVVYPRTPELWNPLGAYFENLVIYEPVALQGVGPGGVYANNTSVLGSIVDGRGVAGDTAYSAG